MFVFFSIKAKVKLLQSPFDGDNPVHHQTVSCMRLLGRDYLRTRCPPPSARRRNILGFINQYDVKAHGFVEKKYASLINLLIISKYFSMMKG